MHTYLLIPDRSQIEELEERILSNTNLEHDLSNMFGVYKAAFFRDAVTEIDVESLYFFMYSVHGHRGLVCSVNNGTWIPVKMRGEIIGYKAPPTSRFFRFYKQEEYHRLVRRYQDIAAFLLNSRDFGLMNSVKCDVKRSEHGVLEVIVTSLTHIDNPLLVPYDKAIEYMRVAH